MFHLNFRGCIWTNPIELWTIFTPSIPPLLFEKSHLPGWVSVSPLPPLNVRRGASMAVPCMAVPSFTRCAASTLLAPGCSTASTPGCSGRRMVMPKVVPPHHTPAKNRWRWWRMWFFCPMLFFLIKYVCFLFSVRKSQKRRERERDLFVGRRQWYIYI